MRVGIDLGGTKIETILLDSQGRIVARARTSTPRDYESTVAAMTALVARIEAEAGARGRTIGIAMPGSLSPLTGLVRNANSTWLNGRPLAEDLAAAFARPVRLANDANCFALSEASDGAAAGASIVFGVILGTGCGGGVAVDGRVRVGASGIAGEWGHIPLPWPRLEKAADESPGASCFCGRRGCMETWVAGPSFARWAGMEARQAVQAAAGGDARAAAALDLLFDRIARGLAVVCDVLDPDVIVVGGGLSNIDALYPAVRGKLAGYVFSDHLETRLVKNQHGDSSGVRGAAWLFSAEEAG